MGILVGRKSPRATVNAALQTNQRTLYQVAIAFSEPGKITVGLCRQLLVANPW